METHASLACYDSNIVRILFLSPVIGNGFGQERVMRDSMELLRTAGEKVFLIGGEQVGDLPRSDGHLFIPSLRHSKNIFERKKAKRAADETLTAITRFRPDVVHLIDQTDWLLVDAINRHYPTLTTAHLFSLVCPASTRMTRQGEAYGVCGEKSGFGCVLHHRKYDCLSGFRSDLVRTHVAGEFLLKRRALEKLPQVIAISQAMEKLLLRDGFSPDRVRLIYNPVAIPGRLPAGQNFPKPLLVCASRIEVHKGVRVLIRAVARLKHLPWTLWVCGDGSDRRECECLASELGLSDRVIFKGRLGYGELQSAVASAKALVQPNLGPEPFGLSAAEASALGVPVIASRVPALDEVVLDEKTGMFFQPGNADQLAHQIERLLSDAPLWQRLSEAGPAHIREHFSPERHLLKTLKAYQDCVAGNTLPIDTSWRGRELS